MPDNLEEARRLANEVVRAIDPAVDVVAATAGGGANYTEIVLAVADCRTEPCTIVLGVNRHMPDADFRNVVADRFRRHRREHPPG